MHPLRLGLKDLSNSVAESEHKLFHGLCAVLVIPLLFLLWLRHSLKLKPSKQSLKRHSHFGLAFVFVATVFVPLLMLLPSKPADALYPYSASSVLGQLNGNGQSSFNTAISASPSPNNSGYDQPESTVVDGTNHRVFVSDWNNGRVLVYNLDNNNHVASRTAAHVLGAPDFATEGNANMNAKEMLPWGLAYDSGRDWLFVSDPFSGCRVMVFDLSGGITDYMDASYVLGAPNLTTSGSCDATQNSMYFAMNLDFDPVTQNLFVYDAVRVLVFDTSSISNGMNASYVLGAPNFTDDSGSGGQAGVVWAMGGAYDSANQRLFVADNSGYRVTVFDLSGGISDGMNASYVLGQADFAAGAYGDPPSQNNMTLANDASYDPVNNRLYVSDSSNNRILIFDLSGGISDGMNASYVLGQADFTSNNYDWPNPTQSSVDYSEGIDFDPVSEQLFVTNFYYDSVTVFDLSGVISNGMNASEVLGQSSGHNLPSFTTPDANNPHYYDEERISSPSGLAIDKTGHKLFVSSNFSPNRILVYDLDSNNNLIDNFADNVLGQTTFAANDSTASQSVTAGPTGLAYDEVSDRLFVADTDASRVLVYDLSGGISNGMNASYVLGQANFSDNLGSLSINSMTNPTRLAYDSAGQRLFVADTGNSRTLVYDLSGGISNGMNASNVLGQPDFSTVNSATSQSAVWDDVTGVTYDSNHDYLYMSDFDNGRVLVYDLSGGISNGMNASYVLGTDNFNTNFNCDDQSCIYRPVDLNYDPASDTLLAAARDDSRIMVFDTSGGVTNGMAASDVVGQVDFTTYDFNSPSQDQFGIPASILYVGGSSNKFYVADPNNSRVLGFSMSLGGGGGDTTAPSVPTNVIKTAATTTTISIAWDPSTDDTAVTGYHVFRDGSQVGSPVGTTFTDTGLTPGTAYDYTVSAYDAVPNESAQSSPAVNISTQTGGGSPPPSPTPPPPSPSPSPPSSGGGSGQIPIGGTGGGSNPNPSAPTAINLDEQPSFVNGSGYEHSGSTGQEYTFTTGSGSDTQNHEVTLVAVGGGTIQFSIDGAPAATITPGQSTGWDVDSDGQNDITVELVSLSSSTATIKFYKITPPSTPTGSTSKPQPLNTPNTANTRTNGLSPFSWLIEHIPPAFLAAFPWLLFLLLLLMAMRLLWQAWNESKATKKLQEMLAAERSLSEQKNNFVTLASHYLRTPLTVISGAVGLIANLNSGVDLDKLKKASETLSANVQKILRLYADGNSDQASQVTAPVITHLPTKDLLKNPYFIVPVLSIAVLVGLADYLYVHVKDYSLGTVNLLLQIAVLVLLAIMLLVSLRLRSVRRVQRANQQALLDQQRQLDSERNQLILAAAESLEDPLRTIRLESARAGQNDKALKLVQNGLDQFDQIIDKLRTVAALQHVGLVTSSQMMELSVVTSAIEAKRQQELSSKNLHLTVDLNASQFIGDELMLGKVLDSLVDNAIKYSPQGGEITISSKYDKGKKEITVSDEGTGIDSAKAAQLFEPFSRVENAAEDFNQQGVGLSLYMDKLIMQYLSGKIELSQNPRGGTTIRLTA